MGLTYHGWSLGPWVLSVSWGEEGELPREPHALRGMMSRYRWVLPRPRVGDSSSLRRRRRRTRCHAGPGDLAPAINIRDKPAQGVSRAPGRPVGRSHTEAAPAFPIPPCALEQTHGERFSPSANKLACLGIPPPGPTLVRATVGRVGQGGVGSGRHSTRSPKLSPYSRCTVTGGYRRAAH